MNSARRPSGQQEPQRDTWPQKLNKALIAVGVIAFGLIITDRVIEMFSADDVPAVQAEVERIQKTEAASLLSSEGDSSESGVLTTKVSAVSTTVVESVAQLAAPAEISEALAKSDGESEQAVDLQEIFGSRVVFVSASEPVYVVTEDDRRFDVGSEIDAQTTLAGVTAQQLILEHAGDLTVISLPDPIVQ